MVFVASEKRLLTLEFGLSGSRHDEGWVLVLESEGGMRVEL